jgi:hypothetical protein
MAENDAPPLEISDLVVRLQRLRDWARESGPPDIYVDLAEACAICEGLADPDSDWNKTVDVRVACVGMRVI